MYEPRTANLSGVASRSFLSQRSSYTAHKGSVLINEAYEVLLSRSQSRDRGHLARPPEHRDSAQGTIFGFKPTPVIVWMGANGFSEYQLGPS